MKYSVKKGDFVKVIAGAEKGKTAQIVAVDADNGRVTLDGKEIGQVKKAKKARKANDTSGLININKTVDISNVMPICGACGKAVRVRHGLDENGKKVRICAKCGAVLETKKKEEKKPKATVRKRTKKVEPTTEAPTTETATTTTVSE